MRSRLKSSGEISRSASLTRTKVDPQIAAIRIRSRVAGAVRNGCGDAEMAKLL